MIDPNDILHSPSASRTKSTRKKTIRNHLSKQRKSNERSRLVSIRSPVRGKSRRRTRSGSRHLDATINNDEKENESVNQGFTQFIQTKMMERKKRQGKRLNPPAKKGRKPVSSPSIKRKREQSVHDEAPPIIPKSFDNDLRSVDNKEQPIAKNTTSIDSKLVNPSRCEPKEHQPLPNNKRRRPCLCSKRHLDELEFASDTLPSQVPIQHEQQCEFEEPYLAPNENCSINHSPVPHLCPSSQSAITSIDRCSIRSNHPFNEREETNEPEHDIEKENELRASSILAMPLSPTMPPNVTYMTRKSIVPVTPLPTTLLALSSVIGPPRTTVVPRREGISALTSCLNQTPNLSLNIVNQSSFIAPIQTISHSLPMNCSVSTQTEDLDCSTHHPCHDVRECPCVRIYTRSEQLFMTNMSVFFRNSIHVATATPEQVLPKKKTTDRKRIKKTKAQMIDQSHMVSSITPIINEIVPSMPTNPFSQTKSEKVIDKTYIVQKDENVAPSFDPNLNRSLSSPIPVDTSTVINETRHERSKKSDGSSIQIHLQTREEPNDLSISTSNPALDSDDRHKFQSFVFTMTALKEKQKSEFHRFVEFFSVRHSSVIDDTTTHLITDEDAELSLICPLTGKVLQAVTRHLIIVSHRWLTACLTEKRYISEIPNFEIIGDNIYEKHRGMSRSRLHPSTNDRLLSNYAFHFKCHGCQPFTDNRPLIELINLSGGLVLNTLNQHINNIGRQIIILCSKTYLQNKPALQQACQKFKILCLEPEWLIATIVQFEVQPFQPWQCTLYL